MASSASERSKRMPTKCSCPLSTSSIASCASATPSSSRPRERVAHRMGERAHQPPPRKALAREAPDHQQDVQIALRPRLPSCPGAEDSQGDEVVSEPLLERLAKTLQAPVELGVHAALIARREASARMTSGYPASSLARQPTPHHVRAEAPRELVDRACGRGAPCGRLARGGEQRELLGRRRDEVRRSQPCEPHATAAKVHVLEQLAGDG